MAFDGVFLGAHQHDRPGLKLALDTFNACTEVGGPAAGTVIYDSVRALSYGVGRATAQFLAKKLVGNPFTWQNVFQHCAIEMWESAAGRPAAHVHHNPGLVDGQQAGEFACLH
ncbi:MAG TPA: hypothetical protein VJW77_07785 [Terriglobia bacterium]|nr:hypothetical protein [Terriglobia bacterium]